MTQEASIRPNGRPATDGDRRPDHQDDRIARVALGCLVEPGSRELGELIRRVGPVAALDLALHRNVSDSLAGSLATRLGARDLPTTVPAAHAVAAAVLEETDRLGARLITPVDDEWPAQLDQLAQISRGGSDTLDRDTDPPICLWVRGTVALTDVLDRSVAIVGARAASSYGQHVAAEFAYGLADRDWTIVSGGAFGIDAAAHRAAMAAGGLTVAVMACGVDRPYPASHVSLLDRIAEEGVLLSEWPPGAAPHRRRFLVRNRVIAALARGTVVVEAGSRSGARNTLRRARELGRPAMAVPGPVTSAMSVGCHEELREQATTLVSTFDQVIEAVGHIGELAPVIRGPNRPEDDLDPVVARVLDAVRPRKARTAEQLAAVAGVSGREARCAMPILEGRGFIIAVHGGGYRLAPRPRAEVGERPP